MEKESDWPITSNRFVAFIDIMGFKSLVARSTHDEIYQLMLKIDKHKKHLESVDWSNSKLKLIKTTTYSDSIMVYSKDGTYASLDSIICAVSGIENYLFTESVPHKGAIAYGEMTLDTENSIFFGQPLIDAYLLQEELQFYGIIGHSTFEQMIENYKPQKPPFILNYLCPLRNVSSFHLTIYPMYARQESNPTYMEHFKKLHLAIKNFRFSTSGYLRKYIDNTESYLDFVRKTVPNKTLKS